MKLKEILVNCNLLEIVGDKDLDILDISFDSRKVDKGTLFFAVKGTQVDGHDYIEKAIEKGATAIVCEKLPKKMAEQVTYVKVDNSAYVLGVGASNFFDNPSKKMKLVGVTGTNGKTTIATLLYRLFTDAGYICGLLSTIWFNRLFNSMGSGVVWVEGITSRLTMFSIVESSPQL